MKLLAGVMVFCSTLAIPAQDGVKEYGRACGEIHCTSTPARLGKDLKVLVNVETRAMTPRQGMLGIGFNRRELFVSGPMRRSCSLYIDPSMVVPVPLAYRVRLRSIIGEVTVIRNIPPTLLGLDLYFQAVFVDGFQPFWSNGVHAEVIK